MKKSICPVHPGYKGVGKPRDKTCQLCEDVFEEVHGHLPSVKPKKIPKRDIVQRHHITYNPEVAVNIRQTEHWALTQIQRLGKPYSRGFIRSLAAVVALYGPTAEEVTK